MHDFERKQMEPRHIKMHTTAHTHLSFLQLVNWYCSMFHSLTPDAQIRTGQSTEVTVDLTGDSAVVDRTKTMHTSSSLKTVERLHELSTDFLCQRVDVSQKRLPWDGQGLVQRGKPPKLVLPEPLLAKTGETHATH